MFRAIPSLHPRAVGLGGRLCKWIRTHDRARCREAFLLCLIRPLCSSRTFVCLLGRLGYIYIWFAVFVVALAARAISWTVACPPRPKICTKQPWCRSPPSGRPAAAGRPARPSYIYLYIRTSVCTQKNKYFYSVRTRGIYIPACV